MLSSKIFPHLSGEGGLILCQLARLLLPPLLAGPQLQAQDQSVPRRTSTESSGSECSPPDLHRKLRIRVFPAGPPPQAPDQSVPRRTSTASSGSECSSSGSECSPPDPHRKLRIRVFPTGPPPRKLRIRVFCKLRTRVFTTGPPPQAQDQSVPRQTSTASSGSKCSLPDLNHIECQKRMSE